MLKYQNYRGDSAGKDETALGCRPTREVSHCVKLEKLLNNYIPMEIPENIPLTKTFMLC